MRPRFDLKSRVKGATIPVKHPLYRMHSNIPESSGAAQRSTAQFVTAQTVQKAIDQSSTKQRGSVDESV